MSATTTASRLLVSTFGSAFVAALLLAAPARAQIELREFEGAPFQASYLGEALANAGDLDGDAVDDLLIGEPYYSEGNRLGRVLVVSGATGAILRADPPPTKKYDAFGWSLASIGDVDFDLVPDYVVGGPMSDGQRGVVVLLSGVDGTTIWSVSGANIGDQLGAAVGRAGDLDADRLPEVLATRIGDEVVDVYSSATGVLLDSVSGQPGGGFGHSLAGLGDLDGDGVDEFAVGEPEYDDGPNQKVGRVRIYSGATRTVLLRSLGALPFDRYGWTVERGDDYDLDGHDDLLVGAGTATTSGGADAGSVHVLNPRTNLEIRRHEGVAAGDHFGSAIARVGDVDLDGANDYVVGAQPTWTGGRVELFSGSDGAQLWTIEGGSTHPTLGHALTGGDWNGDGIADWAAGDPYYFDDVDFSQGAAVMYVGCPARAASYGAGWPGTNGVPALDCTHLPGFGERAEVRIGNSKSGLTFGLVYVGFDDANLPTSAGGTLLVAPAVVAPFYVYGATTLFWGDIPDDPGLAFLELFVQAIEADPVASHGLSFTPGLKLTIGFELD